MTQHDETATIPTPPPASGVRLPWEGLPAWLRAALEAKLGSPVVAAVTQTGGFSPGVAARLRLADGGRAFVKALGPEPNPDSPDMHRSEIRIASALPASAPAPRLLDSLDEQGWVGLIFEDIDGVMPSQPWRPGELHRVMDAIAELAESLTPSPVDAPSAAVKMERMFRGWRRLAAARDAGADDLAGLDPWVVRHLDALAEMEAGWPEAAAGDTLVHSDMRADNILLTSDRVVVVDWPHAFVGAAWFDLLGMLPSVRMQGGPPPEALFDSHPVAQGADPAAVTTIVAALTGYFLGQARQPPPPGLPTLRPFQQAQGDVALAWLQGRTGWK